jgi:hypothetical protein
MILDMFFKMRIYTHVHTHFKNLLIGARVVVQW